MGLRCLHTSIFIETPSPEGLPTKTKEDPSPHEMRLSPGGHQPSISWSLGDYYYYYYYYYYLFSIFFVNLCVSISCPLIFFLCYRIKNNIAILCQLFWPTSFLWQQLLEMLLCHNSTSLLGKFQITIWNFPNSELQETHFYAFTNVHCHYYDELF